MLLLYSEERSQKAHPFGNREETATGVPVAIKVLDLDTQDDELIDIQKEISLLSRCDSPFITRYRGSLLQGSKLWLILDYAGGGSVRGLLKSGTLTEPVIALVCLQVLQAIVYLHRQASIIHRDIKAGIVPLSFPGELLLLTVIAIGEQQISS